MTGLRFCLFSRFFSLLISSEPCRRILSFWPWFLAVFFRIFGESSQETLFSRTFPLVFCFFFCFLSSSLYLSFSLSPFWVGGRHRFFFLRFVPTKAASIDLNGPACMLALLSFICLPPPPYMRGIGAMWQIGVLTGKPCTFLV